MLALSQVSCSRHLSIQEVHPWWPIQEVHPIHPFHSLDHHLVKRGTSCTHGSSPHGLEFIFQHSNMSKNRPPGAGRCQKSCWGMELAYSALLPPSLVVLTLGGYKCAFSFLKLYIPMLRVSYRSTRFA